MGVIYLLIDLKDNLFILFLGSVIVTTVIEYITGWVLEKFHAKWWDYTNNRFNIHGYVRLEFSLIWGFAATFIVRIIHPMVMNLINGIPHQPGTVLACIMVGLTAVDLGATVAAICNMQKKLRLITAAAREIHEISDIIGENVSHAAINVRRRTDEAKELYGDLGNRYERGAPRSGEGAHRKEPGESESSLSIRKPKGTAGMPAPPQLRLTGGKRPGNSVRTYGKKRATYRRISKAFPDLGLDNDEMEKKEKE